jgi:hypothetical protein
VDFGCQLYFEFLTAKETKTVIQVSNVDKLGLSSKQIADELIEKYQIPPQYQIAFRHRVRLANGFRAYNSRKILVNIQLAAFAVICIPNPKSTDSLNRILEFEPHYVDELLELISSEDLTIPQVCRILF